MTFHLVEKGIRSWGSLSLGGTERDVVVVEGPAPLLGSTMERWQGSKEEAEAHALRISMKQSRLGGSPSSWF